jgi:hypothetical protein
VASIFGEPDDAPAKANESSRFDARSNSAEKDHATDEHDRDKPDPSKTANSSECGIVKGTQVDETHDEHDVPSTGSIAPPSSPALSTATLQPTTTPEPKDFFTIQPSRTGGLGAFAARELKPGETILIEKPLLSTTHFQLMLDYYDLPPEAQQIYLSLHGAEDGDPFSRVERIKQLNA